MKEEGQEVRRSNRNDLVRKKERKKQGKKQTENTEKWKVIYTDDMQVETSNDICDAVTSPRDTACLWVPTHMVATPSLFHLASPPIDILLQPTCVQVTSHIHTHVRTCGSVVQAKQSPACIRKVL